MSGAPGVETLLGPIRLLHEAIRSDVVESFERSELASLSAVAREEEGDTLYAIDRVGEARLRPFFSELATSVGPLVLVAEGLPGRLVLPEGAREEDAFFRVIVDPIDGTRGAMYQKRSAWILTGVAPNRGAETSLADIELAVQTEIPLVKQHLSDTLWAIAGKTMGAERTNRLTGERRPLSLRPSRERTIEHGFAMISRFFPGMRDELAAIDEEIVRGALGPVRQGKAHCFEDQYISTAGQLYELMSGHDRFNADLRPLLEPLFERRGLALGICCHPYDLATELIARELGVVVTDVSGGRLSAPLDVDTDVAWVGYANDAIRLQIEPLLREALRRRGLLGGSPHV
jgi:fructose-1,6-bisphosphatase/inositol monophosphatase family enzyme